MVAVLLQEAVAPNLLHQLRAHESRALVTNVIAVWEIVAAIRTKRSGPLGAADADVAEAIGFTRIDTLPVTSADLGHALSAFDRFGRHRYPSPRDRNKGLNIADSFPYATAKDQRIPIFTLDEGFRATDLEVIGAG